jgi:phosphonate transport system substrate-binding protein
MVDKSSRLPQQPALCSRPKYIPIFLRLPDPVSLNDATLLNRSTFMVRKLVSVACVAFTIASLTSGAHADDKTLSFGVLSTEQNIRQEWQPVVEAMSKRLGIKVTTYFAADYSGMIDGMRSNRIQVAWMGNKLAIEAVDHAGGEVFAQNANIDGSLGYYSIVSVHKDSPYNTIDDVLNNAKKINFGLGEQSSTSGYLVPGYYIFAKRNMDPKTMFKSVRGANHEANIIAIANKQIDAAVHSSDTLERMKVRQPEITKQLRQIWQSPLISADPLVWRKDLSPDLKARVKEFFLAYAQTGPNAAQEKAQMAKLQLGFFKESSDAQLKPIRQLELFKEKIRLEADTTLKPADKKARLDEIDRKLAELG